MTDNRKSKEQITELCLRLAKGHEDKNADDIAACYADDAVIYDLAPPLGRRGINRGGIAEWLATWDGPIRFDGKEVELHVDGDIAYMTALNQMRGTKSDGQEVDLWFRTTMCFRRKGGAWRITHDHSSVPFLMDGSERAALDLKP